MQGCRRKECVLHSLQRLCLAMLVVVEGFVKSKDLSPVKRAKDNAYWIELAVATEIPKGELGKRQPFPSSSL